MKHAKLLVESPLVPLNGRKAWGDEACQVVSGVT